MSSRSRDWHPAAAIAVPRRISRDSVVQVASRDTAPCGLDVGPIEPGRWRPRPSPRFRKIGAPAERSRPLRCPCSSETERQRFTRRGRSCGRSAAADAGGSRDRLGRPAAGREDGRLATQPSHSGLFSGIPEPDIRMQAAVSPSHLPSQVHDEKCGLDRGGDGSSPGTHDRADNSSRASNVTNFD